MLMFVFMQSFAQSNCENIEKKIDKFNDRIIWMSPPTENAVFAKSKTFNYDTAYSVTVKGKSSVLSVEGEGVWILLSNGDKIGRDKEEVEVAVVDGLYEYSGVIFLNEIEKNILINTRITDYKLGFLVKEVSSSASENYHNYLNCVIAAK